MQCNLYEAGQFDKNEYFYYDDPNNGDLHEVMRGKFIAFKGPRSKRIELVNGSFTMLPSDYVQVFKAKNVTSVVRLNNAEYDAAEFEEAGLQHHDLFFTDCSTPADDIVERFLQVRSLSLSRFCSLLLSHSLTLSLSLSLSHTHTHSLPLSLSLSLSLPFSHPLSLSLSVFSTDNIVERFLQIYVLQLLHRVTACCSVLQRVVVCCWVLLGVAVRCRVLWCLEVCWRVLKCVGECYGVLKCVGEW